LRVEKRIGGKKGVEFPYKRIEEEEKKKEECDGTRDQISYAEGKKILK